MSRSIAVFDVSSPNTPKKIASIGMPAISLARTGNTLFGITSDSQVTVWDISQPTQANLLTTLSLPSPASLTMLRVSGNRLFVAADQGGLAIFDITTASRPALLSQIQPVARVVDVAVDGNLVLLAALEDGLVVVDVTNPAKPVTASKTPLVLPFSNPLFALAIAAKGNVAYLSTIIGTGDSPGGVLYGFDYRRPTNPRLVTLAAFASQLAASLQTFAFYQSDLLIGGFPAAVPQLPILQTDASQPRNVINVSLPPGTATKTSGSSQVTDHSESSPQVPRKLHLRR